MRWLERLDVRILLIVVTLPLIGVSGISLGVYRTMRHGLESVAQRQAGSTAEIITRGVERAMLEGRADITRSLVTDLRRHSGVEAIDVLSASGKEAFSGAEGPATEARALERLVADPAPFSSRAGDVMVFFQPLPNDQRCRGCHEGDGPLLGAVKVTVSLRETFGGWSTLVLGALAWSLLGVLAMGGLLWWLVRRLVVVPVGRMREATRAIAAGDLTVDLPGAPRGDVGDLWLGLRDSIRALGAVILRIHAVAKRASSAAAATESESAAVVQAATQEADSFSAIASSIEQLDASIAQISAEVDRLSEASLEVTTSSQQTAASVTEVNERSAQLSTAVEEAASTIKEMSHTIRELSWGSEHLREVSTQTRGVVGSVDAGVREIAKLAGQAAEHSGQLRRDAEELGLAAVRRNLEGMESLRAAVERGAASVRALGERSKQIGEIVDVIDEVNERTALLSLNAAILAAQAGKHGAGFQVVANEIRKLADSTARSTVEIASLIGTVRGEVERAVVAMAEGTERLEAGFAFAREAGAAFERILESAQGAAERASRISETTQAQAAGLDEVREAMARLDEMTQFLASGTEEQRREAEHIHGAVGQIVDAARLIHGANTGQMSAGTHIAGAVDRLADGIRRIGSALKEEKEGCRQIRDALAQIVDLPRRNRDLARVINRSLRGIHADTELLETEVARFTVLREEDRGVVRLGVVPLESPAEMHRRFTPLAEHLARALGRPVEPKVALDFEEAVSDLVEGRTQLAYLTPSTYVLAERRGGVVLLATALRNGRPFQHAAIVARSGGPVRALADLKGRTFAFGDPNSTSSHIVPRAMLAEAGIRPGDLGAIEHLGHHDAVARAVLSGEFDAGAVMESVAARYARQGLAVIATSPPIPEFNICASPALPADRRDAVRRALLDLTGRDPEGGAVLAALASDYTGFAEGSAEDYDGVRRMMAGSTGQERS